MQARVWCGADPSELRCWRCSAWVAHAAYSWEGDGAVYTVGHTMAVQLDCEGPATTVGALTAMSVHMEAIRSIISALYYTHVRP